MLGSRGVTLVEPSRNSLCGSSVAALSLLPSLVSQLAAPGEGLTWGSSAGAQALLVVGEI